jgi:hypothetical protein
MLLVLLLKLDVLFDLDASLIHVDSLDESPPFLLEGLDFVIEEVRMEDRDSELASETENVHTTGFVPFSFLEEEICLLNFQRA